MYTLNKTPLLATGLCIAAEHQPTLPIPNFWPWAIFRKKTKHSTETP